MDLKKRILALSLSASMTISVAIAKPANSPTFNGSAIEQASIFDEATSKTNDYEILSKMYSGITKEEKVMEALELMRGTIANFSRDAIMGNNITGKKIKIEFKNLAQIKQDYANFDALGWKKSGKLFVYINEKHFDAPPEALAALLSHEALHQDEFDSLNEETYAWTMEAATWTQLTDNCTKVSEKSHPLVQRENTLKNLFIRGNYTDKYLKKAVFSNPGYQNLPLRSPGFEDENL